MDWILPAVLAFALLPPGSPSGETVPLSSILAAYRNGEGAADATYKGRVVILAATAVSVTREPPAVLVRGEDAAPTDSPVRPVAACVLRPSSAEAAASVQALQPVLLRGRIGGLTDDGSGGRVLTLSDCSLASEADVPGEEAAPAKDARTDRRKTPLVTKAMFAQVAKRMSYEQVVAILGPPSSCQGDEDQSMGCTWQNPDGSGVVTWFHNRKLSVLQQRNLPD